ncbi:hypothetical protein [Cardiobacterium valvarum]|uniref:Uncharacterized protein n=1 Tax=Cardiobacterium valvarum F0432 TaxID=797473 RepID=G9ZCE6_9GAMM|nr:hypothetical protein [Cardiobacterium valvarum]EHM55761.1 hypothetical protein HMPREF9080_00423 [Cardiobacterium valvarum F0432]
MGFLNDFLNIFRLIFSRKGAKKYLNGILEPDTDELELIRSYIDDIRPIMIANGSNIISQQIEQMKIPYLRDFTVNELDFLLSNNIDLYGMLDIIIAKGGLTRGLAAITWDENKQHYKVRKENGIEEFLMLFIPLFILTVFYLLSFGIDYEVYDITIYPIFILFCFFTVIPMVSIPSNIKAAKKRLLKSSNRVIFDNN